VTTDVIARILRSSAGLAAAVALASLAPMLLLRPAATMIALAATCVFALVDPALNVSRRSWWLGALGSVLVWLVFLAAMAALADGRNHLGEGAMVFLLPFMLYPVALAISGLVRLYCSLRQQPLTRGVWIAGTVSAAGFALAMGVQLTLTMGPVLKEKVTGNTPPNTVYSGYEGSVVSAGAASVDVHRDGGITEAFTLAPDTRFIFMGPGYGTQTVPAGREWLVPGQRVEMDYVYRAGIKQATTVTIRVEKNQRAPQR
jgi:hypothetical protein